MSHIGIVNLEATAKAFTIAREFMKDTPTLRCSALGLLMIAMSHLFHEHDLTRGDLDRVYDTISSIPSLAEVEASHD